MDSPNSEQQSRLQDLNDKLEKDSNDRDSYVSRTFLYAELKNFTKAYEDINTALNLTQKKDNLKDKESVARFYVHRAQIYYSGKQYKPAMKSIETSIDVQKEMKISKGPYFCNGKTLLFYGMLLLESGNFLRALDVLRLGRDTISKEQYENYDDDLSQLNKTYDKCWNKARDAENKGKSPVEIKDRKKKNFDRRSKKEKKATAGSSTDPAIEKIEELTVHDEDVVGKTASVSTIRSVY